jgi:hypothetical protein
MVSGEMTDDDKLYFLSDAEVEVRAVEIHSQEPDLSSAFERSYEIGGPAEPIVNGSYGEW